MTPALQRAVAASAIVRAGRDVLGWCRSARARVVLGLGGEWSAGREAGSTDQMKVLAGNSRALRALTSSLDAAASGWRHGRVGRLVESAAAANLTSRIRFVGWAAVAAVVTHALVFAAIGVRVGMVGWGVRAVLLLLAGLTVQAPDKVAAAWTAR